MGVKKNCNKCRVYIVTYVLRDYIVKTNAYVIRGLSSRNIMSARFEQSYSTSGVCLEHRFLSAKPFPLTSPEETYRFSLFNLSSWSSFWRDEI